MTINKNDLTHGQADKSKTPAQPTEKPHDEATTATVIEHLEGLPAQTHHRPAHASPATDETAVLATILEADKAVIPELTGTKGGQSVKATGTETNFQAGSVIGGKYRIVQLLGKGGMGAVYKVEHLLFANQKFFALKILHPEFSYRETFRKRFMREVELAMHFSHEHAIPIRDFGQTDDGLQYFTMDFSDGLSLREILDKEKILAETRALRLIRQVLSVLQSAHAKSIAHRDLKPENILVEQRQDQEHALVLDFGIAKMLTEKHAAENITQAHIVGTPTYMSPEQAIGDELDMRTDIYSVGVMLYEMVTGKQPFAGSLRDIFLGHLTKEVPSPRKAKPDISPAVEKIILKAMAKRREDRFAKAEAMIAAVDRALAHARPLGSKGRVLAYATAVAITCGVGILLWQTPAISKLLQRTSVAKNAPPLADSRQPTTTKPAEQINDKPATTEPNNGAVFKADLRRTGVYHTTGVAKATGIKWKSETNGVAITSPVIANDILYFGSILFVDREKLGKLFAIAAADGRLRWECQFPQAIQCTPAVVAGVVYVGCDDGHMYALDAETGKEIWRFKTKKEVIGSPGFAHGMVYFGSADHYLYALDMANGTLKWKMQTGNPIYAPPAILQDTIYVGSTDTFFYAVDAKTGQRRWQCSTQSYGVTYASLSQDSALFFSGSFLIAIELISGKCRWQTSLQGRGIGIAIGDGQVYATASAAIHSIDAPTGATIWKFVFPSSAQSSPAVANGVVYLGGDNHLYALDGKTGVVLWKEAIPYISTVPVVGDGVVYVGTRNGVIYAVE